MSMDMHAAVGHWGMTYSKRKRVGLRACVCACKAVVYSLPYLRSGAATNDTSLPLHPSSLPTSIILLFMAQRWSFFWATLCGRDRGSGACAKSLSCCRKCGTCSSVSRIGLCQERIVCWVVLLWWYRRVRGGGVGRHLRLCSRGG